MLGRLQLVDAATVKALAGRKEFSGIDRNRRDRIRQAGLGSSSRHR